MKMQMVLKRAAAILVAVCVCVTFVPIAGNYDVFAGETDEFTAADEQSAPESGVAENEDAAADDGEQDAIADNSADAADNSTEPVDKTAEPSVSAADVQGDGDDSDTNDPPEPGEETITGWQTIDGKTYYYDEEGNVKTGKTEIDGKTFYFDEDGVMQTGFQVIDGKTFYFKATGEEGVKGGMLTGLLHIGEKYYYFRATNNNGVKGEMLTGFVTITNSAGNKVTYYFKATGSLPEKGSRLTGLLHIDGNYYYFNTAMKTGFQTVNGKVYYFKATGAVKTKGKRLTGLLTIDGKKYYQNPARVTGIKKIGKYVYCFEATGEGCTRTGWIHNKTRYANGNGTIANGVKCINGKYYLFDVNTGLRKTEEGFYTQSGRRYYVKSSGLAAIGWTAIGKRAYYFYKSGAAIGGQAKDKTIGYLKIPESGYLGEAYALGIKKLDDTKWTLRQAYRNSYKLKYYGRWWRQKTSEQYALRGFKKGKGNCYVMAATFYIQAKLLGYNVRQIHGKVAHVAPHSWTQIKKPGGSWRVYDPNFRNETGRNGWNIYYGKKGTWRYTNYSVFQK